MLKVILAAGGTGGHIFPAIATANELKTFDPENKILFVGAKGGMEERIIPFNGYDLETLWISGLYRKPTVKNLLKNLLLPFKIISSEIKSRRIIQDFKPDIVIGYGGYSTYPILDASYRNNKIRKIIMESNAIPGLSNRMLASKVDAIFLGNENARSFFKHEKIIFTGNPVRQNLISIPKSDACKYFELEENKNTIFIMGGSLGAKSINEVLYSILPDLLSRGFQIIWQTGNLYFEEYKAKIPHNPSLKMFPFIKEMNNAYSASDLVISRSGALTLAELSAIGKAAILVPSPNVADDHQTKNALSYTKKNAAILIKNTDLHTMLLPIISSTISDKSLMNSLEKNIKEFHQPNVCKLIVEYIYEISNTTKRI